MEKYFLTKFGNTYLKDRTRVFAKPCLYLSDTNFTNEQINAAGFEADDITLTREYEVKCVKLHNKLAFIFTVDENSFVAGNKSLVIGFRYELSRSEGKGAYENFLTNRGKDIFEVVPNREYMVIKGAIGEYSRMIYVNNDNIYGGFLENDPSINVPETRMKYGQLQYGKNTIIIEDVFPCVIIPDEVIDNPLTFNSVNQLKILYPYYEEI